MNSTLEHMGRELAAITTAPTYDRHLAAVADAHSFILAWSVGYYDQAGAVPVDALRECMTAVRDAAGAWHDAQREAAGR